MAWEIEGSDEFSRWYQELSEDEIESVNFSVDLLELSGPMLGRPHVDTLKGSRIANLKELRACSTKGGHYASCSHSTRAALDTLSWAATRPATTIGTVNSFPKQK